MQTTSTLFINPSYWSILCYISVFLIGGSVLVRNWSGALYYGLIDFIRHAQLAWSTNRGIIVLMSCILLSPMKQITTRDLAQEVQLEGQQPDNEQVCSLMYA